MPTSGKGVPNMQTPAKLFAITVMFDIVEGGYDEFYRLVCGNAAQSVSNEPGCFRFDVLSPADPSSRQILLYEIYESQAAFNDHLRTRHYVEFDRATRHLVERKVVNQFDIQEHFAARSAA